jgi:hypothetical protein
MKSFICSVVTFKHNAFFMVPKKERCLILKMKKKLMENPLAQILESVIFDIQ